MKRKTPSERGAERERLEAAWRSWNGHILTFCYGCDNSEAARRMAAYEAGISYQDYIAGQSTTTPT